jgi:hypothetical protein
MKSTTASGAVRARVLQGSRYVASSEFNQWRRHRDRGCAAITDARRDNPRSLELGVSARKSITPSAAACSIESRRMFLIMSRNRNMRVIDAE